jgi:hypothetical protein
LPQQEAESLAAPCANRSSPHPMRGVPCLRRRSGGGCWPGAASRTS